MYTITIGNNSSVPTSYTIVYTQTGIITGEIEKENIKG